MSVREMFATYQSQGRYYSSQHEDESGSDGHMDIGGEHYDYPHCDCHTDE